MILKTVILLITFLQCWYLSSGQGRCVAPTGYPGVCQVLPNCPALLNYYSTAPNSRQVINFLFQAQAACGNQSYRRNPIVCCRDDYFNNGRRPLPPNPQPNPQPNPIIPPITTTTTTTTTTAAPTTSAKIENGDCLGPDLKPGVCKSIRDCPTVLPTFIERQADPDYIRYIQNSNAICKYVQPNICCPFDSSGPLPTSPPPPPPGPRPDDSIDSGLQGRLLAPNEGCGVSNVTHNRVVGGVPAKKGAFPWMALLGYTDDSGQVDFKCGGSLITTQHILTAAHCIRTNLARVRLGEHDLTQSNTDRIEFNVIKQVTYPNYDKKDGHSDLAVLTMDGHAPITKYIRPICLPLTPELRAMSFVDYNPFVAGWGRTQEGGKSATVLQELMLPVLENKVCEDKYQTIGKRLSDKQFDDAVLCAGFLAGGKDSCQGDSGGPLMQPRIQDGNPVYYQIGVVSYGIGCARADIPGVYARVQTFVDWISDQVNSS